MAHIKQSERIRRIERDLIELDRQIEQSHIEMKWVLKHRVKIWLACIVFWALILWGIL